MKIKRKPVMAARGYNDDTVYVIFRKVRVDGQWIPCAFWYSSGQMLNYGRLYVIEPEFNGYTCEETDMSYYNASKKLTPADPGYDDLKAYTYDWLSDHGDGQGGFKKIVERQRVDYNALRNSWYRDTIPDNGYIEYSVHSSTRVKKHPVTASEDAGRSEEIYFDVYINDNPNGSYYETLEDAIDTAKEYASDPQYADDEITVVLEHHLTDPRGEVIDWYDDNGDVMWSSNDTSYEGTQIMAGNDANDYEELALSLGDAIKRLASDEEHLSNFVSYLTQHFPDWLNKYASTPEGLVSEFTEFANMNF